MKSPENIPSMKQFRLFGRYISIVTIYRILFKGAIMNTLIIVIVSVTVTIGTSFGLYKAAEKNMKHVHGLEIPSVDISDLNDSVYNGSYSYLFMPYRVAVAIEEKQIKKIEVTKNYKRKWAKMAEGVIPRVLEAQNTNVDAVSGATTTSKALLMAIYNALEPNHDREKNKDK
jgi:uncharacterized protein with FMN-binding domain